MSRIQTISSIADRPEDRLLGIGKYRRGRNEREGFLFRKRAETVTYEGRMFNVVQIDEFLTVAIGPLPWLTRLRYRLSRNITGVFLPADSIQPDRVYVTHPLREDQEIDLAAFAGKHVQMRLGRPTPDPRKPTVVPLFPCARPRQVQGGYDSQDLPPAA